MEIPTASSYLGCPRLVDNSVCCNKQDSVDELVAKYADPRKPPAFWSLDRLTDDMVEMVNGPGMLGDSTRDGLHVQLNYMMPELRIALLVALQGNLPLPPHPSEFPVTLRAKVVYLLLHRLLTLWQF